MNRRTAASTFETSRRALIGAAGLGAMMISVPMAGRALAALAPPTQVEEPRLLPAAAVKSAPASGLQKAILAGGCFWGVQAVFQRVEGVTNAVSGYAGGTKAQADYNLVSSGKTGHAEAVEVTFDPKVVSYDELLRIFFSVATDPTQLNQQFPDAGPQYRNEIFYIGADQKKVAEAYIAQLNRAKAFRRPIVTKVTASPTFYPAEPYHQNYLVNNPRQPYIAIYDMPKLTALKKHFPSRYREKPVLVAMR